MNLRFFRQPILVTAMSLLCLYLVAVYFQLDSGGWERELWRVGALSAGFLIPHGVFYLLLSARPRISNLLITLLILALLTDTETGMLLMFSLGMVTAVVKLVIRVFNQPVFNPAAAGLFLMSFVGLVTTWWGVSFSPRLPLFGMSVSSLIVIPVGLWIVWLYRKLPTLFSVTAAFAVAYFLLKGTIPLRLMLEGTFAFYLLFMVTEPKTTPVVDWQEWINGVAIGLMLAFLFVGDVTNPYLIALLLMNFVFAMYKWVQLKMAG